METKKIEVDRTKCSGCWSCRMICSLTFQKRFNPLEAFIKIEWDDNDGYAISFEEDCTDCTLCATYCSFGALTIKKSEGG